MLARISAACSNARRRQRSYLHSEVMSRDEAFNIFTIVFRTAPPIALRTAVLFCIAK